ncbi:hypothetical protein K2173_009646 [Erythroxylum novogranatense]|uniref:Gnk2-homologous domain-containing protein n=1 Tax=Erythroxylum novogranatense TaxID=1862640 RepID=A0AAV8U7A1_9ROSI|nr:hypothetical protein K2173_009646 [Erythroxylum novogranatense]
MRFSILAISFLYPLLFALINLPQSSVHGVDPLSYVCSSPDYSPNDAFASNMNQLFTSLFSTVPNSGYGGESLGQNSDRVHGLALCTSDVRDQRCKTCLEDAGREIRKRCPSNKRAIIWYDDCMLKYSNKKFFGSFDRHNKFYQCNPKKVCLHHRYDFTIARLVLLDLLMTGTRNNGNLYASHSVEIRSDSNDRIYGFSQCTRDISIDKCLTCLGRISSRLRHACFRRTGGKYLSGSCMVRYESYPFAYS